MEKEFVITVSVKGMPGMERILEVAKESTIQCVLDFVNLPFRVFQVQYNGTTYSWNVFSDVRICESGAIDVIPPIVGG